MPSFVAVPVYISADVCRLSEFLVLHVTERYMARLFRGLQHCGPSLYSRDNSMNPFLVTLAPIILPQTTLKKMKDDYLDTHRQSHNKGLPKSLATMVCGLSHFSGILK
jgi:hypothetical protein